ncbi:polymer-forming cytoskeletal protein [Chloroflexota bacterium]
MKRKGLWLGLVALLLLLPTSAVFADNPTLPYDGGQIFTDEDVTLEPGETLDGDLGIFDGDLTVSQGSVANGDVFIANGDADIAGRISGSLVVIDGDLALDESGQVQGDVFVMSGDQEIAGQVQGDLSVMFGDLTLLSTAVIQGDLIVMSGSLEREAGAQVLGEEIPEIPLPRIPFVPERPSLPELPERPVPPELPELPELPEIPEWTPPSPAPMPQFHRPSLGQRIGQFVGRTMSVGFLSLIFIAVGLLIVLIWPRATRRVSDCIGAMPGQSFALGLLTFLIAVVLESLAVVLMILIILVAAALIATIILIPFGLLLILLSVLVLLPVPLALAGGMVLGWIGLAEMVGRKVLKALNASRATPLSAVFAGLLVTVPFVALLWIVNPLCCAWPFVILLTSVGLGAVIHTRFGTQSCRQSPRPAGSDALPLDAMDEEVGLPDVPAS